MPLIGLTGGYASGKSSVTAMFRELGADVIDCDILARQVVEPGAEGLAQVKEKFGPGVISEDGTLNRAALGAIVFNDRGKLNALEAVLHPHIRQRLFAQSQKLLAADPRRIVIVDAALLFETELSRHMDKCIAVTCLKAQQVERGAKRDKISPQDAEKRVALQMPISQKTALADYVVDNSGSAAATRAQVEQIWNSLKEVGK
ncbi:MAG: dephospho-CoA kinase [Nitrospinae bacterium]|nr:dephospho-CoA kinase [Nitrospinota bacterium]